MKLINLKLKKNKLNNLNNKNGNSILNCKKGKKENRKMIMMYNICEKNS